MMAPVDHAKGVNSGYSSIADWKAQTFGVPKMRMYPLIFASQRSSFADDQTLLVDGGSAMH